MLYLCCIRTILAKLISFRACYVYLQADQKLYQHVYEKEGNMDDVRHVRMHIFNSEASI